MWSAPAPPLSWNNIFLAILLFFFMLGFYFIFYFCEFLFKNSNLLFFKDLFLFSVAIEEVSSSYFCPFYCISFYFKNTKGNVPLPLGLSDNRRGVWQLFPKTKVSLHIWEYRVIFKPVSFFGKRFFIIYIL